MLNINKNHIIFANLKSSFCCLPSIKMNNLAIAKDIPNQQKSVSETSNAIFKHTGIFERRYSQPFEAASDLAIKAIENSSVDKESIEALIVATTSGDYPSPATAHFVHKGLNLNKQIHCLDVASSCSSFLSAFRCSFGFMSTNSNTLVVATEVKHKGLLKDDLRTRSLFGDGAAGIFLEKTNNNENGCDFFQFCHQESISSFAKNICIPVGGTREPTNIENIYRNKLEFQNPKVTYLQIVKSITEAVEKSWEQRNQIIAENLDHSQFNFPGMIFIHQANKNIIKDVKKKLNKNIADRIPILMGDTGNMVCASLPVLRTRVIFLKSLFYYKKSKLLKKDLIDYFSTICKKSELFSFKRANNGIQFIAKWENESIHIFDDGCSSLDDCWLSKLCEEEFNDLQNFFENEISSCQNLKSRRIKCIDIWITAGGGFQTIAMIHGKM
jgi:3-oxoacyl-[acyl-carrier-protein] synthase III